MPLYLRVESTTLHPPGGDVCCTIVVERSQLHARLAMRTISAYRKSGRLFILRRAGARALEGVRGYASGASKLRWGLRVGVSEREL
jgi:hypothetical protein